MSGEARTRYGGGERAYRGWPDYGYLAAASPRSQRIPLPPRHFRGGRFSAPPGRQIVVGGPNLYPGLRWGPPAVVLGGSAAVFKVLMHLSLIVAPVDKLIGTLAGHSHFFLHPARFALRSRSDSLLEVGCDKPCAPRLTGDHPAGWARLGRPVGSQACKSSSWPRRNDPGVPG